jgi:flagellar biosynthetic protein FlhB
VAGLAALGVLAGLSSTLLDEVRALAMRCFRSPIEVAHGNAQAPFQHAAGVLALCALPVALATAVAAAATGFAEAGFRPRLELAMPTWSRLDPRTKLQTMFAPGQFLSELGLALGRVAVVGYVVFAAVSADFGTLSRFASASLPAAGRETLEIVGRIALRATLALAGLGVADYLLSRLRIEKQLMMSRQEIKDEHKQNEGDPKIKARMRARARDRIKRALAKQVKQADVIVTNPTHVSVALRYRPKEGAPVVTAKGYDEVAMHIRAIARENGIHILQSPPLARALAARVRVGRTIPVDLYAAVAEILAYVYKLRNRRWS